MVKPVSAIMVRASVRPNLGGKLLHWFQHPTLALAKDAGDGRPDVIDPRCRLLGLLDLSVLERSYKIIVRWPIVTISVRLGTAMLDVVRWFDRLMFPGITGYSLSKSALPCEVTVQLGGGEPTRPSLSG